MKIWKDNILDTLREILEEIDPRDVSHFKLALGKEKYEKTRKQLSEVDYTRYGVNVKPKVRAHEGRYVLQYQGVTFIILPSASNLDELVIVTPIEDAE